MEFLQKINAVWQKIGVVQRALLTAIVIACVLVGFLLTKWASQPDMRLLYRDLGEAEASAIVEKISELNVKYELRGGTSIYVPDDQVYQLRLSMAKDGLPKGGKTGYEIFDNEKIGVSPLVQQINYNRAMQDELAKTIQMIEGVEFARVHLVRPEETLFTTDSEKTSASVVLRVRPGWQISGASIAAITNLVAGAIEGLGPEMVTVVNSQGRLLTTKADSNGVVSSANTFMDYKSRVEQSMADKVQGMLELVLGPNRSTVKISAEIDMTSIETMTKKYDKGIPIEETVNSTSTVKPGAKDSQGAETSGGSTDKTEKVDNKYMLPETVTKRLDVPGKIVSLSVSAVVDLSVPKPAAAEGETGADGEAAAAAAAPAEGEPALIMTVDQVKEVIRNAVGPSFLKDETSLIVVNTAFNRPTIAASVDSGGYEKLSRYIEIARQSSMGVLAVCALLVLKIISGGRKKLAAAEAAAGAGQIESMGMGMLPAGTGEESSAALRRHITGALRDNPEQVKQLFASWLSGEE
ncbi:MAG: flagellar basal-body MS-ring/collar protein FliF [Planctomycetota bacterium]|jgi:flagellar M-ring protein FliF